MDVAARAGRVGEVLLADEHERLLGHLPVRDELLGGGDLAEAAADVDGAGPPRLCVCPRHAVLHGEVDLERAGPVAVARERARDPSRHPVARDSGGGGRGDVEHHDVRRAELVERRDADAGLELRAVLFEQRDHRDG